MGYRYRAKAPFGRWSRWADWSETPSATLLAESVTGVDVDHYMNKPYVAQASAKLLVLLSCDYPDGLHVTDDRRSVAPFLAKELDISLNAIHYAIRRLEMRGEVLVHRSQQEARVGSYINAIELARVEVPA